MLLARRNLPVKGPALAKTTALSPIRFVGHPPPARVRRTVERTPRRPIDRTVAPLLVAALLGIGLAFAGRCLARPWLEEPRRSEPVTAPVPSPDSIVERLACEGTSVVPDEPPPRPPRTAKKATPRRRRRVPRHPPSAREAVLAATTPPQPGFLSVHTTPWVSVWIDGAPAGATPLVRIPLSSGSHRIRLVNEAHAIDTSLDVQVPENDVLRLGRRFDR